MNKILTKHTYFYQKLVFLIFLILCSCEKKDTERLYSKNICNEKVAPFYYKNVSNRSEKELKSLCKCLWEKFPNKSWQRKLNIKLYEGEDIGWKIKSFSSLFEKSYKDCLEELDVYE